MSLMTVAREIQHAGAGYAQMLIHGASLVTCQARPMAVEAILLIPGTQYSSRFTMSW